MTSPIDSQTIVAAPAGCAGQTTATAVGCAGSVQASSGCRGVGTPVRDAIASRPHLLGRWLANRPHIALVRSTGCVGTAPQAATGCSGTAPARSSGCQGVSALPLPSAAPQRLPTPPAAAGNVQGAFLDKVVVRRELRKALRDPSLMPEQRAAAERVLRSDDGMDMLVAKAHADLTKRAAAGEMASGNLLQQLLAWVMSPQGQAFIAEILRLLGL